VYKDIFVVKSFICRLSTPRWTMEAHVSL